MSCQYLKISGQLKRYFDSYICGCLSFYPDLSFKQRIIGDIYGCMLQCDINGELVCDNQLSYAGVFYVKASALFSGREKMKNMVQFHTSN